MDIFFGRISQEDMDVEEAKRFSSKEDYLSYKQLQQEEIVKKKFNIDKFDKIFFDSGSAYKMDLFHKREVFHEFLQYLFNYSKLTVKSLFWGDITPHKDLSIYTYDYNRISRIIEYNLLFSFLCDIFNIKIFSANQDYIKIATDEDTTQKGMRYIFLSLIAMKSEEYSSDTNKNTKKAVNKQKNTTLSYKNNVWGKGFKTVRGKKLTTMQTMKLKDRIVFLVAYHDRLHHKQYYREIIDMIYIEFKVKITKSTISKMRD